MEPKMSVSCKNSDSAISSSIQDSLDNSITKASNLGKAKNQLSAALRQILLKATEYVEAPPNTLRPSEKEKTTTAPTGSGIAKNQLSAALKQILLKATGYVEIPPGTLKPSEKEKTTTAPTGSGSTLQLSKSGNGSKLNGGCLPSPRLVLFPREKVQIGWGNVRKWSVGSGMVNLGNSCYINSTLQALFHVPSFANWLQSDSDHRSRCGEITGAQNGCIICSMADVLQSTQSNQCPTKPMPVYSKLKEICPHLVPGRQGSSCEFLRYLMESMEKAYLSRYKNSKEFEQNTKETTPINQIFGGYLRTSVKCLSCQYESVTFQHFKDLQLDTRKVNTIDDALKDHFARRRIEDTDYTCGSCKRKVSATKQFSLEGAPAALCIELKRFSSDTLNKYINFSPNLDLSQYSSRDLKDSQLKYRLVSMITHLDMSPEPNHSTAIGCCQDGSYYQFDDSSVRSMSNNSLLHTNQHIIFYELVTSSKPSITTTTSLSSASSSSTEKSESSSRTETSTPFIGPFLPMNQLNKPVLLPVNHCATKPYSSSTSNGFADNSKLVSVSNNQKTPQKKSTDHDQAPSTTVTNISAVNISSPSETPIKNVEMWSVVSKALPLNVSTSMLVDEIINKQRENGKRKIEKDIDLDMDIGRMKKKRSNGRNGDRDNPNYNAFQKHQNRNRGPPQRHNRRSNNNKKSKKLRFTMQRWNDKLGFFQY